MTALHPQTMFELIQRNFRDAQATLHTPPVFPPAQDQAELAAQHQEMSDWERQELYGKPISPIFWQTVTGFAWLSSTFLFICAVVDATTGVGDPPACLDDGTLGANWCQESMAGVESINPLWTFLGAFVTLVGLLVIAHMLKIPSDPDRYYSSRLVRGWATFLRIAFWCVLGFLTAMHFARQRQLENAQMQFYTNANADFIANTPTTLYPNNRGY